MTIPIENQNLTAQMQAFLKSQDSDFSTEDDESDIDTDTEIDQMEQVLEQESQEYAQAIQTKQDKTEEIINGLMSDVTALKFLSAQKNQAAALRKKVTEDKRIEHNLNQKTREATAQLQVQNKSNEEIETNLKALQVKLKKAHGIPYEAQFNQAGAMVSKYLSQKANK